MNDLHAGDTGAPTEFFFALTPDVILDTVERQGLQTTGRCYALNSLENRVYDVELEDGERVVMKFYRPGRWSADTILEEHRFLQELDAEGIPVTPPVDLGGGRTLDEAEGILYAGFRRARGRPPEELRDEQLLRLGRFLARIHNIGARSDAPHRRRLDPHAWLVDSAETLRQAKVIPPGFVGQYVDAAATLAELVAPRFADQPVLRLHGDCHKGNLLFEGDKVTFVDFDDMVVGPAAQDLWLLTPGRDAETLRQRELLVDGYEELRELDRTSMVLVEALRAMRFVRYSAWVARRWEDPAFPGVFPAFTTDRYWAEELEALLTQVELVREALQEA